MTTHQPSTNAETQPISPLMAAIVSANVAQLAATTDTLISNLEYQVAHRGAELALIREGIADQLAGPYMPNPAYLERALWPSDYVIRHRMEENGYDFKN